MLKHFELLKAMTNNATQTVAINPANVIAVYETYLPIRPAEGEEDAEPEKIRTTIVVIPGGQQFNLEESYLDVVARLNEQ
jgi:hypothetical protein